MNSGSTVSRLIDFLIHWRWVLLVTALTAAAVCFVPASRLQFDRSIENLFASQDPLLPPYERFKRTFGGNELALVAYTDPELLTAGGIERLDRLTQRLKETPGVDDVISLTTTPLATEIVNSPLRERFLDLFEGYLVSRDRRTVAAICVLAPEVPGLATSVPRDETVSRLREIAAASHAVVTGEPVMVVEGFRHLERDGRLLGGVSTVLLMLTIVVCFRSIRWVIVPMAVVLVTLWVTKGLLTLSAFRLSMVSSMLWANITVIGISMVVHVVIHFRELRGKGLAPREALHATGNELALPILWTFLTDTAGFGALLIARVGPVQDFGLMMVVGSIVALFSVSMVLPGMALWGRFASDPQRAWGEGALEIGLHRVVNWVQGRPKTVGIVALALLAVASLGSMRLEVDTDFTNNFRAGSPLVKSYEFVESNLGGAGVWDVMVPAPAELDRRFLDRVRSLETKLRGIQVTNARGEPEPGLTKVLSLADVLDAGSVSALQRFLPVERQLNMLAGAMPSIVTMLRGEDPAEPGKHYLRIMLRARERQPSAEKQRLIDQVGRIAHEEFPEPGVAVTGFFVLLTSLIDSVVRDQWLTFALATTLIGLMMLIAFRSLRLAVVALTPNLLPVFCVTGLLGWLGIKLNMGGAMIAAVSMGLAVDASVHYITAFLAQRRQGAGVHEAIRRAQQDVGRANVFSTLALVIGFGALALSEFVPTIYFGVLVSLTMIGGLIGNLVLLPLLLGITEKDDRHTET